MDTSQADKIDTTNKNLSSPTLVMLLGIEKKIKYDISTWSK